MADQDLNIHIKALDETGAALSNLQASTLNISKGFHDAGRSMTLMGREIGQIGSAMVMMGTAITAPMLLAFKTAEKYSPEIKQQIGDITDQWDKMAMSVATSMIPAVQGFTDKLSKVTEAWNSLSQAARDHLVQTTLAAGGYLLYGGVAVKALGEVLKVTGDLLKLTAGLFANISAVSGALAYMSGVEVAVSGGMLLIANSANKAAASVFAVSLPMLGVYAAVLLLVAAMYKWQAVNDTVISAAEVVWKAFWAILIGVKLGFTGLAELAIDAIEKIVAAAANITHLPFLKTWEANIDNVRKGFQGLADQDMAGIAKQMGDINNIVKTGQGDWSATTDGWKLSLNNATSSVINFGAMAQDAFNKASLAYKKLTGGGMGSSGGGDNKPIETWLQGLESGLTASEPALNQWAQNFETIGKGIASSLQSSLGSFFDNVFTGQLTKASQFFVSFGQSMLKTFSNVIAQMITQWIMFGSFTKGATGSPMGGVVGAFSSLLGAPMKFHEGGAVGSSWANPVVAHDGLAVDEVPAVLQSGEGVLSRDGMSNLAKLNGGGMGGGKGVQIHITPVIQAWDATDVLRNMRTIHNSIAQDLMNNGQLRTLIRNYQ